MKREFLRGWILAVILLAGCGERVSGTVTLAGSSAMGEMTKVLAEQFMEKYPHAELIYIPSNSSAGIVDVKAGEADVGLSSRLLKDGEKEVGLTETVAAIDGIAVIVHEDNPVEELTTEQIGTLFSSRNSDWAAVGGGEGKMLCVGYRSGSGTRFRFEEVTRTEGRHSLDRELENGKAVIEMVRENPQAVGYVSLSALTGEKGVKPVAVDGVPCTVKTVHSGAYPMRQPFVFVTKEGGSEAARAFVKWTVSRAGRDAIRKAGVTPLVK